MCGDRAQEHAGEGTVAVAPDDEQVGTVRGLEQDRSGVALLDEPMQGYVRARPEGVEDCPVENLFGDRLRVVVGREGGSPATGRGDLPACDGPQLRARQAGLACGPLERGQGRLGSVDADNDEMLAGPGCLAHRELPSHSQPSPESYRLRGSLNGAERP